jgi:hypothetical protein
MGLRFDLAAANWVAYLIKPRAEIPMLAHRGEEIDVLRHFLSTIETEREKGSELNINTSLGDRPTSGS